MYNLKDEISEFEKPESLASLVKRLGSPVSTTLLHSPCRVFQIPEIDGAIGYYQIRNCAVAVGGPICSPKDSAALAKAFDLQCQKHNLKAVYLSVYEDFAHWAVKNGFRTLIQIGSELSINPTDFQIRRKLKWHVNQALQHGVQIQEYKDFDPPLENQINQIVHTWLTQRRGPQIHLGRINFFNSDAEKRIFYARQKDKIIGALMLTPLDRFQGWVMSSYLAILGAPVGTTEHLICSVSDSLAQENCQFFCLGAISGTQLGEVVGLSSFGKTLAAFIFKMARWFFKLDAKAMYLHKYHPDQRATFLLCKGKLTISELLAIKQVLNVKV